MDPEKSSSPAGTQQLIKKLGTSEHPLGPMFAESLIELYERDEFSTWIEDELSLREYEAQTSAVAWRFIILDGDSLLIAPVLIIAAHEKNDRIVPFMKDATANLKEPVGETKRFVDGALEIAVDAARGIELQTVAAMQISEHHTTGKYITEIAYPRIYQEIGQIDVLAAIGGLTIEPLAKKALGVSLAINLLKQVPFGTSPISENL